MSKMFKKALIVAVLVLAASSAAWAQAPKVEVSALFGYSFADGVSGDPVRALNGQTYDRVDPKDSMNFTLSGGFFVGPNAEVGFMWRRSPTTLQVSGTTTSDLGDINIDGYHGFFAYNFGESEAKVRPYILAGLGATHYGGTTFTKTGGATGTVQSATRFSTTWGAGVKIYPAPKVGVQFGVQWTPTYIKSDAAGWWCDPWWGCYLVGDAQYSNQFEFAGGVTFRF
jgi:opacity protein-like surface antigen